MDKLERYLDQVCRGIGGPRSLRQHIRRELREHLRDAAAQHQAAGLSEDEAMERALADFGGPEQVGSELEATHGHRLMTVLIDKALQWQEKTMKAKWLWTIWAHTGLLVVMAMDLVFIWVAVASQIPTVRSTQQMGIINFDDVPSVVWLYSFLNRVEWAWERGLWWLAIAVAGWALFEWRVRSENKSLMRLSAFGTAAAALTIAAVMTASGLVLPFMVGTYTTSIARPFAVEKIAKLDTSVAAIEQGMVQKDWQTMQTHIKTAGSIIHILETGPSMHAISRSGTRRRDMSDDLSFDELRARLQSAKESLLTAQEAVDTKDAIRLGAAMKSFHEAFDPIRREAQKKPER